MNLVSDFLDSINLGQYKKAFLDAGYDDLEVFDFDFELKKKKKKKKKCCWKKKNEGAEDSSANGFQEIDR